MENHYNNPEYKILPYSSSQVDKGCVVVFSPHPDDEIFGCGGALLEHVKNGDKVIVYVITNGGYLQSEEYILGRKKESISAKDIIGYDDIIFLNYNDRGIDPLQLEVDVFNVIKKDNPKIIYVPHSDELHPDHRIVNNVVINSLTITGNKIVVMNYEISQPLKRVNFLLAITNIDELSRAFDCFTSQLERQDYKEQLISLKRYRSYTLTDTKYAEAFYREYI